MINENTTIKFQTRQSVQEVINLVRSGMPICVAEAEDVGLTMVIPSVQDAIITYKELTYTVDCFMMKFADSMCDRLLYDGIATKRHLWTVYVKGEFVTGDKK
jgi:hypothetical protein